MRPDSETVSSPSGHPISETPRQPPAPHPLPPAPRAAPPPISAPAVPPRVSARSLWLGVFLGFASLFVAWTILFTLVSANRVPEVPLATARPKAP